MAVPICSLGPSVLVKSEDFSQISTVRFYFIRVSWGWGITMQFVLGPHYDTLWETLSRMRVRGLAECCEN